MRGRSWTFLLQAGRCSLSFKSVVILTKTIGHWMKCSRQDWVRCFIALKQILLLCFAGIYGERSCERVGPSIKIWGFLWFGVFEKFTSTRICFQMVIASLAILLATHIKDLQETIFEVRLCHKGGTELPGFIIWDYERFLQYIDCTAIYKFSVSYMTV